jgi:beta-aspartyl-peptidase (threonine type)
MNIFSLLSTTIMVLSALVICPTAMAQNNENNTEKYVLVIHGGAGAIQKKFMTPEKEAAYETRLQAALDAGEEILKNGGTATDAVEAAINVMEDSPLFNAGKGAVFTNAETNEMDASFMDGNTMEAGAVAGVTTVKNPISAARAVLEKSNHVLLSGEGADEFAKKEGLEIVDPSYFRDENRLQQLKKVQEREEAVLDHDGDQGMLEDDSSSIEFNLIDLNKKLGTVGAVALDQYGNLAAGTSTGGMTNKRYGRIGDSPLIGAGTYADNRYCAVSSTGHGEYFIRYVVAYDIIAIMKYKGVSLLEASNQVIHGTLSEAGGTGGVICVDKDGNIAMPFNTSGMYRGFVTSEGQTAIMIYNE